MSDDVSNRINKIGSRADLMKQPFKIYENLRSAVSVYRGHGSSSRSGVYQVTEVDDEEEYDSVDSSETSDGPVGHQTDDSGIDSITSPSSPAGEDAGAGVLTTLLEMKAGAGDTELQDNKMAVGGGSGHKSFLHHDTYSGLWRRDLVLNSSNSSITNNSSSVSSSGVRLTSVRHKREDSDDIRSDTSSDNLIDDNDDSDSNNPDRPKSRVYQIGVCSDLSELSELSELLASTNNVLQRNSNLRASLTISAVKRSTSSVGRGGSATPRNVRKSMRQDKKLHVKPETKETSSSSSTTNMLHHNSSKMIGGCDDDPQEQDQKEEKRKVESEGSDETGGNVNGGIETTGAGWEKLNVGSEVMSNTKQDSDSAKNPTASTKDEAIEADPEPKQFVRAYRDRNGCFKSSLTSPGMRMSMAIRPQTVSNLASKFDSIIHEKTPLTKSNSRQLKLRTYDISKIITELNKLNTDLDNDSAPVVKNEHKNGNKTAGDNSDDDSQNKRCDGEDVKKTQQFNKIGKTTVNHDTNSDTSEDSCGEKGDRNRSSPTKKTSSDKKSVSFKVGTAETGSSDKKNNKIVETDEDWRAPGSGQRSGSRRDDCDGVSTKRVTETKKENVSPVSGSLAGRYLAAVNSGRPSAAAGGGNNGVKLTSSGMSVPSVRQTQKLLLLKTGQAADDTSQNSSGMKIQKPEAPNNGPFPPRRIPTEIEEKSLKKSEEKNHSMREIATNCDRFCDTSNSKVFNRQTLDQRKSQSLANCQREPNSSFLWNKVSTITTDSSKKPKEILGETTNEEDVYDDVQNCHNYAEISRHYQYDDVKKSEGYAVISKSSDDLTESGKNNHIYLSADNLTSPSIHYDDIDNIKNSMNSHEEDSDFDNYNEEDFQSDLVVTATPAVVLEDGFDSLSGIYDDIRKDDNDDQLTLYESIAGSLLRLDKLEGEDVSGSGIVKKAGVEVVSYSLADMKYRHVSQWGNMGTYTWRGDVELDTSDRSDEWVDIDTDEDYEERNLTRHVHFARNSIRASRSSRRAKVSGSRANTAGSWSRAVRDVNIGAGDSSPAEQDSSESIYEIIRPAESESDFEEIPEESDEYPDYSSGGIPPSKISNSNLSKIAEAAGRKMKKLKTNWSIKKSDITRSLSRIKKNSRPALDMNIAPEGGVKRKLSRRLSQNQARPQIRFRDMDEAGGEDGDGEADTMFYITLTIEEDSGTGGPLTLVPGHDSDVDSNTYSQMSTDSGSSAHRHVTTPTRRTNRSNYSVVRPGVPPPAPPTRHPPVPGHHTDTDNSDVSEEASDSLSGDNSITSSTQDSSSQSHNDSLLLCDSLKEFYVGMGDCDSGLDSTEMEETYTSSLFQTEPLYQFYDNNEDNSDKNNNNNNAPDIVKHENVYETVDNLKVIENTHRKARVSRSSAMDIVISSTGRRSLWAELPEVIDSGILTNITPDQKKLQEAMFEVISSEASYLKSLNILISHFVQSSQFSGDTSVLSKRDQRILFSEVIGVRSCSEKFLADLESRWQESVLLSGISDIIMTHAKQNFHVYVKYCSNQVYQDRTLKRLRTENPAFVEALKELECQEACQGLAMHSFLMLPMQRITRLPLLTDAIASRLPIHSPELETARHSLDLLSGLVSQCNESARYMERMEEMLILSQQLDFRDVRAIPLISASRWLVRRGDCTRLTWKENGEKLTFGRRVHKQSLALFLFTDMLVVTKKKGEERFLVLDYSSRNMVQMTPLDSVDTVPGLDTHTPGYALWLTLLQNHENRTVEMLLCFTTEAERTRWVEAVTPCTASDDTGTGERVYEQWDCPRVEITRSYPDQDLNTGDTVNVLRKTKDGDVSNDTSTDNDNIESSKL